MPGLATSLFRDRLELCDRLEREMIPLLNDQGLGLLVWSRLAGGFLSGKFTRDGGDETARRAKFDFPPVNKEKGSLRRWTKRASWRSSIQRGWTCSGRIGVRVKVGTEF